MRVFSSSERKILESSPYVVRILPSNQISYTDQFKKILILSNDNGLTRVELFNSLLGVSCFDKKYVDSCLNRWRKESPKSSKETRGRKKSIHKMSIEELKAENAYQKEVIAHLKKLRGLAEDDL